MPTAMLAAGIALALLGAALLWSTRSRRALPPTLARISLATRYLAAVTLLLIGYHLAVWAYPPTLTPVQFPRAYWWAVVGLPIAALAMSLMLDATDRPGPRKPS